MRKQARRIFLGTMEIAGFYTHLASGLRELGADCSFVELSPHLFEYRGGDASLPIAVRLVRWSARLRARLSGTSLPRRMARWVLSGFDYALRVLFVLPWAAVRFDVFCFGFNSNIVGLRLGYWDLALLRLLGKRIVCLFHGDDSRPPYLSGAFVRMAQARGSSWPQLLSKMALERKRVVVKLERIAHVTIDGPWRGHFHEKRFLVFPRIGVPCPIPETVEGEAPSKRDQHAVRILHAPSSRATKGSEEISACISRLKPRYDIEYIEIRGLPHSEVLGHLARCDFVIDQLYSDSPMAGLATEAASMGKPAVVCGYLRDRAWLDELPTHYCHPDQLDAAVTRLITDRRYREELGQRAREYVMRFRSRQAVAGRMLRIINGDDVPEDWWFDPRNTSHLHGAGMSETQLGEALRGYIDACGSAALQLDDKPELRDRLVNLANAILSSRGITPRR